MMQRKDRTLTATNPRGVTMPQAHRGQRRSTWMPPRRAMVPTALPRRFVEGVAWDEV
jgi:hypothetical protein